MTTMQTDSIIYDQVSKAEDILSGQLGVVERLQEVLGGVHSTPGDVVLSIVQGRRLLADIGAALDRVDALFGG